MRGRARGLLLGGALMLALAGVALGMEASGPGVETGARGIACPVEPGPETGKEATMETAREMDVVQRTLPPVDAVRPARTELATFALG